MSLPDSKLVEVSIRHIIPDEKEINDALIMRTTQYYNKSIKLMGKLPSIEEQERLHICAYIAIRDLKSRISIKSKISLNQIALPGKKLQKVMNQITEAIEISKNKNNKMKVHRDGADSKKQSIENNVIANSEKSTIVSTVSSSKISSTKVKRIVLSVNGRRPASASSRNSNNASKEINISDSDDDNFSEVTDSGTTDDEAETEIKNNSLVFRHDSTSLSPKINFNSEILNYFAKSPRKRSGGSLIDKLVAASSAESSMISNNNDGIIVKSATPKKRKRLSASSLTGNEMSDYSPPSLGSLPPVASASSSVIQSPVGSSSPFRIKFGSKSGSSKKLVFNNAEKMASLSPNSESPISEFEEYGVEIGRNFKKIKHDHSPLKSSPLKSEQKRKAVFEENVEEEEKDNSNKFPNSKEIIDICNILKIPKESAIRIILQFRNFENRIKEKWGLICGLIISVYIYIFRDFFIKYRSNEKNDSTNLKQRLYNEVWKWQRGKLTQKDLQAWHSFCVEMIGIDQLEEFYELNNNNKNLNDFEGEKRLKKLREHLIGCGRMIDPKFDYSNEYYCQKYENWADSMNEKIADLH